MELWPVGGTTTSFQLGGVALLCKAVPQQDLGIVCYYRFEVRVPTQGAHRYCKKVSKSCIRPLTCNSKLSLKYLHKCTKNWCLRCKIVRHTSVNSLSYM